MSSSSSSTESSNPTSSSSSILENNLIRQSLPGSGEVNDADVENGQQRQQVYHIPEKSDNTNSMKRQSGSILISSLPINMRKSVEELKLDVNGDGALDTEEIIMAVDNLATKVKDNASLKKIVWILCGFAILLVSCVFGATITAARLSKDTEVDATSGIMYAKGSAHSTLKTEDVVIYSNSRNIADMTNDELRLLKEILLTTGDVKFQIKGYARGKDGEEVKLLVEGGTITYDVEGIASATGDAKELLDFAYYGEDDEEEAEEGTPNVRRGRRYLQSTQSTTGTGSGSGDNGASNNGRATTAPSF